MYSQFYLENLCLPAGSACGSLFVRFRLFCGAPFVVPALRPRSCSARLELEVSLAAIAGEVIRLPGAIYLLLFEEVTLSVRATPVRGRGCRYR